MRQRKRPILNREVRRFLREPRTARLATIGADGYPHIVPIWFMLDGKDIVFGSDRDERKVRNASANPKGAVVIGGEPTTDGAGYLIQGNLSIENDVGQRLMRRMLRRYQTKVTVEGLAAEWADSDMVVIRLRPKSVIRVW